MKSLDIDNRILGLGKGEIKNQFQGFDEGEGGRGKIGGAGGLKEGRVGGGIRGGRGVRRSGVKLGQTILFGRCQPWRSP